MAEPQDRPDESPQATPAAKKAAAKKAPAKKAPAKKAPAKTVPAKKAPAKKAAAKKAPTKKAAPPQQPALKAGAEKPALKPAPSHAALTGGTNGARPAAAGAKSSEQEAVAPRPQDSFGRGHKIPLSLGLAVAGLVAIALSRFRRG